MKSNKKMLLIVSVVAVLLVGVMLLLLLLPSGTDGENTDETTAVEAKISLSVDKNSVHQAEVAVDSEGNIESNGGGSLISYSTGEILQLNVENENGAFEIKGTLKEGEGGKKTSEEHILVGFENYPLGTEAMSGIITDASSLVFNKIATIDKEKAADYGLDKPLSTATVTYVDNTKAVIYVGDEAPQGAGRYVKFGSGDAVYVVDSDAVDTFLCADLDLLSRTITEAAVADNENEEIPLADSIEISGTNFEQTIKLTANTNENNAALYVLSSPQGGYANEEESDKISHTIKGLTATDVVALSPDENKLSELGLSNPYAKLKAVYGDEIIELKTSKPDEEGNVNLIVAGGKMVYEIDEASLPWISTNPEKLVNDYVLHAVAEQISTLEVGTEIGNEKFFVSTEEVETTDDQGNKTTETQVNAIRNDLEIESRVFTVFIANLTELKLKSVSDEKATGEVMLTLTYKYEDSKSDTVKFYAASNGRCLATVNGKTVGYVYKSTVTKLSEQVHQVTNSIEVEDLNA